MKRLTSLLFGTLLSTFLLGVGCTPESEQPIVLQAPPVEELKEPEIGLITVQHILLNFGTTLPGDVSARSEEQARTLAEELKQRADGGEDYDGLVAEYTADQVPGIMKVADSGVDTNMLPASISSRKQLVQSFGDVAFSLEVGEVGIAEYDKDKSPFGFHVIKRLK